MRARRVGGDLKPGGDLGEGEPVGHQCRHAVDKAIHIGGAFSATIPMVGLYYGCRTIILRDVDPSVILKVIPEFGITNAFMVPAVIQFLLMTPGVEDTDFSSLRALRRRARSTAPVVETA